MAKLPQAVLDLVEYVKDDLGGSVAQEGHIESLVRAVEALEDEATVQSADDGQVFYDVDEREFIKAYVTSALAARSELEIVAAFSEARTTWADIVDKVGVLNTRGTPNVE